MWKNILMVSLINFTSGKTRYDNYALFKITPENDAHIKLLQEVQNQYESFDFWAPPLPSYEFVNVMTTPGDKSILENYLNFYGIKYEITLPNVQDAIDKQTVKNYTQRNIKSMTWDAYYKLPDIESWMDDMATAYPEVATKIVGGISYENREIKGLKISHGEGRRVIFIEAGIHSREWIVMTFACYLINELLTSTNSDTMVAARDFDWYIFPVTNPDGYVWTYEENRMWRKNRRPIGGEFGVDLNRNWNNNWLCEYALAITDFMWKRIPQPEGVNRKGEGVKVSAMAKGASVDPSTDIYAGPGPFSEPETRSLSNFISSIGDKIDMYLSFHSYGQLLLLPFGNSTEPYANYHDAMNIGRRAMGALSVRYGTQYTTGNIAEAIYEATGGSVDWVKAQLRVPIVYCFELRDRGTYGFLLPTDQILPTHLETMDAVLDLIYQGKRFGYLNNSVGVHSSVLMSLFSLFAYVLL